MTRRKDNFIEALKPLILPGAIGIGIIILTDHNASADESTPTGLGEERSWWQQLVGSGSDSANPDSPFSGGSSNSRSFNNAQELSSAIQSFGHVTVSSGDYALSIAQNNPDTFQISDIGGGTSIISFAGAMQNWSGIPLPGQYKTSGGGQFDANLQNVQRMLNRLPSSQARLKEDGVWGNKTSARLLEFQRQQGLSQTGHWDQATLDRLQTLVYNPASVSRSISSGAATSNATPMSPVNYQPGKQSASPTSQLLIAAAVGLGLYALVGD